MSGTTCTWAHHAVREGHRDQAIQALWCTVGLGIFFSYAGCRILRGSSSLFQFYRWDISISILHGDGFSWISRNGWNSIFSCMFVSCL